MRRIPRQTPHLIPPRPRRAVPDAHAPVGSPAYWSAVAAGLIDAQSAQADHDRREIRRQRALEAQGKAGVKPSRHSATAPRESRQYAQAMSTTAARDRRLTGQAKALLQVLVARAGQGEITSTTKATLAATLGCSARSIQRHLKDLALFGYIKKATRHNAATGMYAGLCLTIQAVVRPFYAALKHPAFDWRNRVEEGRRPEETELSSIKSLYIPSMRTFGLSSQESAFE